ncbi:MAG: ComF family protein, partial [Acidobacteria bacterium]|nr:ComF family protein [Acidobacteriota bacterium]
CRRAAGFIDRGGAAGHYDGALRSIIHALKYEGRRSIGRRLARLLRAQCADVLAGADGVVPVPLHPRRLRSRGFNQAAEIARHLDLPLVPVLQRQRDTQPQMELPASRRHRNVKQAFALTRRAHHRDAVRGRRLVIVDDVSTTGATVQECARVLKRAGALEVRAVTVARVVRSRP